MEKPVLLSALTRCWSSPQKRTLGNNWNEFFTARWPLCTQPMKHYKSTERELRGLTRTKDNHPPDVPTNCWWNDARSCTSADTCDWYVDAGELTWQNANVSKCHRLVKLTLVLLPLTLCCVRLLCWAVLICSVLVIKVHLMSCHKLSTVLNVIHVTHTHTIRSKAGVLCQNKIILGPVGRLC